MPTRAQLRELGLTREQYESLLQSQPNTTTDTSDINDNDTRDSQLSELVDGMLAEDSRRSRPRPIQQMNIGQDFTPYYNYHRYNDIYELYRKRFYNKKDDAHRHRLPDQFEKTEQVSGYTRRSAKDPESTEQDADYYEQWYNRKR